MNCQGNGMKLGATC